MICINELFEKLQPLCKAIYLGGSRVNPYIKNHHDYDYIMFVEKEKDKLYLNRQINRILRPKLFNVVGEQDFMNVRSIEKEEHSYGSYINKLQQKIVGEDIEFKFDIIGQDRNEYKQILLDTIKKLENNKIRNKKRYYQVIQGIFILKNNSYELNEEQVKIINEVHDQMDGWEKYLSIVENFRKEN